MTRDAADELERVRAVRDVALRREHAPAAVLAQAALDDGIQHPFLFNVVALNLEEAGRLADAEVQLRRGLELAPDDTGLLNALGLCLLRQGRSAEALAQFESLLARDDSRPYFHASRGSALLALGRYKDAEASYRRAVQLDPQHPVALAGLANLSAARGAYATARSFAERALTSLPGYPDALLSLAAAELGEGQAAQAEERVRGVMSGPMVVEDRAYAHNLLGDALDAQGRLDEAFAAYQTCNDGLRSRFAGSLGAREYLESLEGYFRNNVQGWQSRVALEPRPPGAHRHVFVLGFPRSGSTLLKVTLDGHPSIVSLEEKELLIDPVRQLMQCPQDLQALLTATPASLGTYRDAYMKRATAALASEGGSMSDNIFVDVEPLNTLKLLLIAILFPGAKILFACRDPRDVVFSCFRHRFNMSGPSYELLSLEGAARYYDAVMHFMVTVTGSLPLDVCLVRHEDVLTAFAREMRRVCEFLNIHWAPGMSDFAARANSTSTAAPTELTRLMDIEGIGHWRRYRAYMEPVLPILQPWVRRFYYEEN